MSVAMFDTHRYDRASFAEASRAFSHDLSSQVLKDDVLARLLTFPNVLVTSHQAFLTLESLSAFRARAAPGPRGARRGLLEPRKR